MKEFLLCASFIFLVNNYCISQSETTKDSIIKGELTEVVVKAFEQNRRLQDVPAAISYIGRSSLNRYSNTTILPAVNSVPGVRMEERSPGSYRLNIRGSSLRAPFGVRNVKVYYNNIPLTDPGGNTYLNQLGFYNFQSIEVIKGPGSSLYGSGTGGVMLIESTSDNWAKGFNVDYSTRSYNLQNVSSSVRIGSDNFQNTITYQHQTSSGYREQSEMRRDVFSWTTRVKSEERNELTASFLYGDLFYETPGPLNLNEYNANPTLARPRAGGLPGSKEAHAAIFQKTVLAGASYKHSFNSNWQNATTMYGALTNVTNPTIRNYERRSEPHFGGRTIFQYQTVKDNWQLTWHTGAELQQGISSSIVYNNIQGNPDSLRTNDELQNRQAFVFSQLSLQLAKWIVTGGISLNQIKVKSTRFSSFPIKEQERNYNNEFAPRLAVLRKLTNNISAYSSVSRGFSPPTSAEVLPSSGVINTALNAEHGINYEAGLKGSAFKGQLSFDVNVFNFRLKNTIVQRRDATSADYFINAGSTKQNGVESYVSFQPKSLEGLFFSKSKIWLSHTYNDFHYKDFKQVANDFSGKQLPGAAPHTVAAGIDLFTRLGFYLNLTYYYSDPIALNDANTDYATCYNLLGGRFGFERTFAKAIRMNIYAGAENLFDVKYSLGNDVNGFGGRYYNAAAGRNYFAGLSLQYQKEK